MVTLLHYIAGQQNITITWKIEWVDGATLPPSTVAPTSAFTSEFPDLAIAVIVAVVVVITVIVVVVVCCYKKRASK